MRCDPPRIYKIRPPVSLKQDGVRYNPGLIQILTRRGIPNE